MIAQKQNQEVSNTLVEYVFSYEDFEEPEKAEAVIRDAIDRESDPDTSSGGVILIAHDSVANRESWYFDGEPSAVDAFSMRLMAQLSERYPRPFTVHRYPAGFVCLH